MFCVFGRNYVKINLYEYAETCSTRKQRLLYEKHFVIYDSLTLFVYLGITTDCLTLICKSLYLIVAITISLFFPYFPLNRK
jgi:hypothetical protein